MIADPRRLRTVNYLMLIVKFRSWTWWVLRLTYRWLSNENGVIDLMTVFRKSMIDSVRYMLTFKNKFNPLFLWGDQHQIARHQKWHATRIEMCRKWILGWWCHAQKCTVITVCCKLIYIWNKTAINETLLDNRYNHFGCVRVIMPTNYVLYNTTRKGNGSKLNE